MSEAVERALSPREQYLQQNQAKYEAEYAEAPVEESDTDGTPDESMESEAGDDGALAVSETDQPESDIDDDTPDDGEAEVVDWEARYIETQQSYTEGQQELSKLKSDMSESMGEITNAKFELNDRMEEVEQVAQFWANQANHNLAQLQQVNPQQLTQEQYAQWQQQVSAAQHHAAQVNQALAQTQDRVKKAKEDAVRREAAISRASLVRSIDNFDEVYPEIGKFAVDHGVNPRVWSEITDPGLVKLLHKAMVDSSQPDTIETVVTKTKAKKHRTQNTRERDEKGRYKKADKAFREARNPRDRRAAYLAREQARYEREYRR